MSQAEKSSSRLRAWCELIRVPNLFTVPGDPVAGFLVASAVMGKSLGLEGAIIVVKVAIISLLVYVAGLIDNDVRDVEIDRRERPNRPIPSGRVSRRAAAIVMLLLFAGAIGLAYEIGRDNYAPIFRITGGLVACVLIYNRIKSHSRFLGSLFMGLCRAGSMLVGVSILGWDAFAEPVVILMTAGIGVYISSVTWLAYEEACSSSVCMGFRGIFLSLGMLFFPIAGLGAICGWLLVQNQTAWFDPTILFVAVGLCVFIFAAIARRLYTMRRNLPRMIGEFIRAVLIYQGFLMMVSVGGMLGGYFIGVLIVFYMLSLSLGKKFYAS